MSWHYHPGYSVKEVERLLNLLFRPEDPIGLSPLKIIE